MCYTTYKKKTNVKKTKVARAWIYTYVTFDATNWNEGQIMLPVGDQMLFEQGITNTLALPINNMLYICILCPHSEHQNNLFQSKQSKQFHQRNQFV
jgi:hypothetical protein